MKDIRNKVRAFILAITGLLVTLLVVRVILLFVGANQSHPLVSLVLGLTDLFVQPLFYVAPGEIVATVDLNSVLAIVIYAILGILISEFVTAFFKLLGILIQDVERIKPLLLLGDSSNFMVLKVRQTISQ